MTKRKTNDQRQIGPEKSRTRPGDRDVDTGGERAEQKGQNHTRTQGHHTQRGETRSREAAADRRREGTQGPDRVLKCLNGRPKGDLEHQ